MERMVKAAELAEFFSVTRQTIYAWRREGMPAYDLAGSVRFKKSEVMDWLEKRSEQYKKGVKQ